MTTLVSSTIIDDFANMPDNDGIYGGQGYSWYMDNISRLNQYEGFYHEYLGRPLGYRIKLPDNYDPAQSYPVMIWGGADSASYQPWYFGSSDSIYYEYSRRLAFNFYPATWLRQNFSDFISIIVQPVDWQEWVPSCFNEGSEHPLHNVHYPFIVSWADAVRDLINSINDGTAGRYKTHTVEKEDLGNKTIGNTTWSSSVWGYKESIFSDEDTTYSFPNIDMDRIFAGGWSGGAGSALRYTATLQDMLAGVFALAGWFEGQPYKSTDPDLHSPYMFNNLEPESDWYNPFAGQFLEVLAKSCMHLPIFISVGGKNSMSLDVEVFADKMQQACEQYCYSNKFIFRSPPDTGHSWGGESELVWDGEANCVFRSDAYFDAQYHQVQRFRDRLNEGVQMTPTEWIHSISKATNKKPYPLTESEKALLEGDLKSWDVNIVNGIPQEEFTGQQDLNLQEGKRNYFYTGDKNLIELSKNSIAGQSLIKNKYYEFDNVTGRLRNDGTGWKLLRPKRGGVL